MEKKPAVCSECIYMEGKWCSWLFCKIAGDGEPCEKFKERADYAPVINEGSKQQH